jgi:hypothetical protein
MSIHGRSKAWSRTARLPGAIFLVLRDDEESLDSPFEGQENGSDLLAS